MIQTKSVVLYKGGAALITGNADNGKFPIDFMSQQAQGKKPSKQSQNVRQKDFIVLSEEPASSLEAVLSFAEENAPSPEDTYNIESSNPLALQVKDAWELLSSDEETAASPLAFSELVSLFHGELPPDQSYALYLALKNTVYFSQNLKDALDGKLIFLPRSQSEIDELVKKADEKGKEAELREAFLTCLKKNELLPEDSRFMGDVEALALGKTDKSRTMHDAHIKETPEKAHKLLLDTGIWQITRNPYPLRWGLSMQSASESLSSPPEEERIEAPGIAYAIDSEWSTDPDDAVCFDGKNLWIHIADPASTVMPDSSIDKSARARGATLYIPEGASRMLCEDALEDYALGLTERSRALSFKLTLAENGSVEDCEVLKTFVKVKRLTYTKADELMDTPELKPLFDIAWKNVERRNASGAVQIDIPEVHIMVDPETKKVSIEKEVHPKSSEMIREMMLLAGEGAAKFAFKNKIPFPFVSQEAPTIPEELPEGLAREFRLRRCMHRRSVGVTPGMHCGLGLNMYSQVTSPLRRYSDLIAHQQLRAFIDKRPLLDKDTMLMRVSEGDASAIAARNAERKSNTHWTLVYLLQNPDWTGEAICVDKGGRQDQFFLPDLGMETFFTPDKEVALNQSVMVKAANINLPELSVNFIPVV